MLPIDSTYCPGCESMIRKDRPFCAECGRLSPAVLSPGNLSVELQDIPSEEIRRDAAKLLHSWFPDLDTPAVQEALGKRRVTLVAGIDEDSGNRILEAFKHLKARGRLVSPTFEKSLLGKLWNPGLLVSAICLINAAIFGGLLAFFALIATVVSPIAWAVVDSRRRRPLVPVALAKFSPEQWKELAEDYAQVMKELAPADREMLASITRTVFDVHARLASDSVAGTIAGGERGGLYKRLRDAIRTAVELCRSNVALPEQERPVLAEELKALRDVVTKTGEWFRALEADSVKAPSALQGEIADITDRIDALVREVRSPLEERLFPKEKAPS